MNCGSDLFWNSNFKFSQGHTGMFNPYVWALGAGNVMLISMPSFKITCISAQMSPMCVIMKQVKVNDILADKLFIGCQVSILLVCKNESRSPILWTFNMTENQVPIIAQKSKFDIVYSGHNKRNITILEQAWQDLT